MPQFFLGRRLFILATTAVLALFSGGCRPAPAPSLVVITIDTLRADRLGCYGNPDALTPALDRLAGDGVLFEDVTAPAPITLPSHASMFTGRYPAQTGVRNNGSFVVPGSEITLAEILEQAGWATGAVIAAFPLQSRFGLDQGFGRYDEQLPELRGGAGGALPVHFPERDARDVTERSLEVWRGLGSGRRFLWVHYFDPHAPYSAPEAFASPSRSRYDAEVAYTDSEVGRLIASVRSERPDTIVAVVADHGEGLGEHDEKTHGIFVYQSTLAVPWIISAPGRLDAGTRVSVPVSLIDLTPTLLGLVGIEAPEAAIGADLGELIDGGPPPTRPVLGESYVPRMEYRFSELLTIRHGALKYIEAPAPELYDLSRDPAERTNLLPGHPAQTELSDGLLRYIREMDAEATGGSAAAVDPETEARLRSLGYLAAGNLDPTEPDRAGRDPKDMTAYFREHDRAMGRIAAGELDEGVEMLRELADQAPENFMVHYQIAAALFSAGRHVEAERDARRVVEAAPDLSSAHRLLGEVLARQGKLDGAVAAYEEAARHAPASGEPLFALGDLLESVARFEPAAGAYRAAVLREPDRREFGRRLLRLHVSRGNPGRAVEELRDLAEQRPASATLWTTLAVAERRAGREPADAMEHLNRALELAPNHHDALVQSGELHLEAGRAGRAETSFRRALETERNALGANFGLARALLAQDRGLEADAAFAHVLTLDPSFSPAHTVRGQHHEQRGDLSRAAEAYTRALRINPRDGKAAEGLRRLGGSL